ncbi:carbonic anhydrase [Neoconidiobolus thromboides FSU 785]|nr:carbonic anhydrase [Neoconidiobolus thromboides FSU 785]
MNNNEIDTLLNHNQVWSKAQQKEKDALFKKLAVGQSPKFLWLGCSDSRVPESTIFNQDPGTFFVHRNVANVIKKDDPSLLAALDFSIRVLKVEHIILCGHSDCGGVKASFTGSNIPNVDQWLSPVMKLCKEHQKEFDENFNNQEDKEEALCHLNIFNGIKTLKEIPVVKEALSNLYIHSWIYDVGTGKIKVLNKE